MILKYEKLQETKVKTKKKKNLEVEYLPAKEFAIYKKEAEDAGEKVSVVRNTRFKKIKDQDSCKDEFIEINGIRYALKDEKNKSAVGYVHVGDNRFVRYERSRLPLLLSLMIVALLLVLLLFQHSDKIPKPEIRTTGTEYKDETASSTQNQIDTIIPGYAKIKANKAANIIKLRNPDENTVNFVYTITTKPKERKVKKFATTEKAQEYINENQQEYTNNYDKKNDTYVMEDSDGNIVDEIVNYTVTKDPASENNYIVQQTSAKILFVTGKIAPGYCVDWNAYDTLKSEGKGTHYVQFLISSYDVNTDEPCTGSTQTVDITLN